MSKKHARLIIMLLLMSSVYASSFAQSNGRRTVGVHQLDPRFTFAVEKYWSGIADSEEYFYYVKNNTSEEYKMVIEVTLTLNCIGTRTYKLGFNKEVYLKPNGMFTPKDDWVHINIISSDREKQKACLIAEGDTHTLYRGLSWTLSNIVNITAQKQEVQKKQQQEEQARQQKIAEQKKRDEQARQQQMTAQKKQQEVGQASTGSQNSGTGSAKNTSGSASNLNNNSGGVRGSSALSEKVSVNGQYVQVFQQNGKYYMVGSNGQQHETTKIAYDKVNNISNTKRANAAAEAATAVAATATTTSDVPENTSGNNPLANYNPGYYNANTTKTEAIVGTAVSVLGFIGTQMEESRRKREQERQVELERSEAAARLRAEKENARLKREQLIAGRKTFLATYPVGKTPLSSQDGDNGTVYFFGYSYQQKDLENDAPQVYVSNTFSIAKYSDGTWPQKAGLIENISRTVKINNMMLSGFYLNSEEAEQQQQAFFSKANQLGLKINRIDYTVKKTEESSAQTDFWGNPVNAGTKTPVSKATETPIKKGPEKKEVELDFWGNPVKK